jgi:hypothetical protein
MRFNEGRKNKTHTHRERGEKPFFSPPFWPQKRKKKKKAVGYIWSMSANETSGPPISRVDVHSVSLADVKKVHRDNYSEKNLKFFPDLDVSTEKDRRNSR